MRTVRLPGLERPVGAIGFGCASLGSRISAAQGLDALADAHAAGVNWFDVAPAYGAGDAEAILGRFARGKRDGIYICTKVGLAPPQRNALLKQVYSMARPIVGTLTGLRRAFRRMPSTRNVSLPLTPQLITDSLHSSLQRLGTDHVDVFALHKPAHGDIGRDDIQRALQGLRQAGKVRLIGVAGDLEAAQIALANRDTYTMVQLADDPSAQPLQQLPPAGGPCYAVVTHSILGVGGTRERVLHALRMAGPAAMSEMIRLGYSPKPEQAVAELLLDRALAANANGVVLMSMFGARHRSENLRRVQGTPKPEALQWVSRLLAPVSESRE
ncbi:MAG: aldo/keto reductase [Burkholderiales bacterium]|nr:aldo/keto reductase [Burkholderiales bacterium]